MHRGTWKKFEARVARMFGTTRAPLSGINGGVTASDSLSPDFFIEVKMRKRHALWSLFDDTRAKAKKENKVPVIAVGETNRRGALICIHSDDLGRVSDLLKEIASERNEHLRRDPSDTTRRASEPGIGSSEPDSEDE